MKIKKYVALMMVLAMGAITACGSPKAESGSTADTEETKNIESQTLTETDRVPDTELSDGSESETSGMIDDGTADYDRDASMAAFADVLEGICRDHVLPDGQELEDGNDMTQNYFAVYDVDADGRDELIISYTMTSMAEMFALIYDYDAQAGELVLELRQFPALTFFDNGVITAAISHNQGYAGEFWPYTYYKYDSAADTYKAEGFADAWDKSLSDVGYNGETFPDDADKDGDGIVYYIGEMEGEREPIDMDAYNEWYEGYVGNKVEVPFVNLTQENIDSIR